MNKRVLRTMLVAAGVVASMAVPGVAQADEFCTDLPGSTTGATLEVGEEEVRIPAIRRIQLCQKDAGPIGGIPMVYFDEPNGSCTNFCYSVVLSGSSGGGDGYVALRYYADSQQRQVTVPVPGGGPATEQCLVGVGAPARDDCEVKLSLDRVPTPRPICLGQFCVPGDEIDLNEVAEDPCSYFFPQISCN